MKPVSLRMEAFGPYATAADIDFEPLADVGLFVVSGPTGAGKSTIFDAICFALYGSLSGARQSHVDVRSHYADPAAECLVQLVFDANDDRWRVTRQPAQVRQKRRGSGTTERPADAVLERWVDGAWHPDAAKVRDVSARCRQLVGLSLEQFERVVLLPQGKFAEVLNARTADRADLLRTLFGSEVFERVGDVLAEQAKAGERELHGAAEQRDRFHRRAIEALDRAAAELAELPDDVAAGLDAAASERRRLAARSHRPSPETGTALAPAEDGEPGRCASQPRPTPVADQLSLLAPPDDAAEPLPGDGLSSVDGSDPNDHGGDPVVQLATLQAGPLVDLETVAATMHESATRARSDLERAEAQAKAIEQRRSAIEQLRRLDAQSAEMASLADRLAAARRVVGLAAAITRREQLATVVDDRRGAIDDRWARIRALVAGGALGRSATELDQGPSPDLLGSLLSQTAARLSTVEALIAEEADLERQRNEHASVLHRIGELDTQLVDSGAELDSLDVERRALEAERKEHETKLSERNTVTIQFDLAAGRVQTRRRLDAATDRLALLDRQKTEHDEASTAARSAIEGAGEELTRLDARIEQRAACEAAVESARRRLATRSRIESARADLDTLDADVSTAQARADEIFAAFVRGAAPRLAADLAEGAPCPVCGSCDHPVRADADHPDRGSGTIPGGTEVDVAAVEAAAAAAADAQARRGEGRAVLAGLVAEDPDLVDVDPVRLDAELAEATTRLGDIDRAESTRAELVAAVVELEQRLAATQEMLAAVDAERSSLLEEVAGLRGELGNASDRTLDELTAELTALQSELAVIELAAQRTSAIESRLGVIAGRRLELERTSETLRIDRATSRTRLDHLVASIQHAEAQRRQATETAELEDTRTRLVSLRQELGRLQHLATAEAAAEASLQAATEVCRDLIADAGFDCEEAAVAASMAEPELEAGEDRHRQWVHRRTAAEAAVEALDAQGLPDDGPDLETLRQAAIRAETRRRAAADAFASLAQHAQQASADLAEVSAIDATTAEQRAHHDVVRRVASVVRGNNSRRLSLENWVLSVYLHDVVEHANLHLHTMSNGRYRLLVRDAPSNQVGQHGLDLVIDDAHTGRVRPSVSLSGGETFQASLALALGLADVVMVGRAGLHLDALFVDEGFGSLDPDAIDQAITVLDGLRSRGSMVGVITHVEALKNALPVAIEVHPRPDRRGSEIRQVA